MTRQEVELMAIEYAMNALQTECKMWSQYFQTDILAIEYELFEDYGKAYLVVNGERRDFVTIRFQDVATVLRFPLYYTEKPFEAIKEEFNLQAPQMFEITQVESEEQLCQETN